MIETLIASSVLIGLICLIRYFGKGRIRPLFLYSLWGLAAFSKKYPPLCRLDGTFEQGGVSYILDKSRLSIRLQPSYSEERRQKASLKARQNGFKSQSE